MADNSPNTPRREPGRNDVEHREDALDAALADSFPASDPPAMVRASRRRLTTSPQSRSGKE
jgi:hypothetical protein